MEIKELKNRPEIEQNKKLFKAYNQLNKLLTELKKKEIPEEIIISINDGIDKVNSDSKSDKELKKQIRKTQSNILNLIEKKLKLVTKNHFRNTWLALGLAVFGIPLGVTFGVNADNMGLLGLGLPLGIIIGMAIGSGLDKKAFEEGRQLNIEINP